MEPDKDVQENVRRYVDREVDKLWRSLRDAEAMWNGGKFLDKNYFAQMLHEAAKAYED